MLNGSLASFALQSRAAASFMLEPQLPGTSPGASCQLTGALIEKAGFSVELAAPVELPEELPQSQASPRDSFKTTGATVTVDRKQFRRLALLALPHAWPLLRVPTSLCITSSWAAPVALPEELPQPQAGTQCC